MSQKPYTNKLRQELSLTPSLFFNSRNRRIQKQGLPLRHEAPEWEIIVSRSDSISVYSRVSFSTVLGMYQLFSAARLHTGKGIECRYYLSCFYSFDPDWFHWLPRLS